jgi:hypothetical protein
MSKEFYENAISPTEILSKKLILSLKSNRTMRSKSYQGSYAPFQPFWNAWISDPSQVHNHCQVHVLQGTMHTFLQEIHCGRAMAMELNPSLEHA